MSWDIGGPHKRNFPCLYCGTILPDVVPPDDIHTVASRIYYAIPTDLCLAASFVCANPKCGKENTIYWYTQQAFLQSLKWVPQYYPTGSVYTYGTSGSMMPSGSW